MTYAELKRRLRRLGMVLDQQGGRHEIWRNPATGLIAPISRHDSRDVPAGMVHAILRELGVARNEFNRS